MDLENSDNISKSQTYLQALDKILSMKESEVTKILILKAWGLPTKVFFPVDFVDF